MPPLNENDPISDEQRQALLTFADKIEAAILPIIKEMREAKTVGDGRRLLDRMDAIAITLANA